jgi:hypothetical protein
MVICPKCHEAISGAEDRREADGSPSSPKKSAPPGVRPRAAERPMFAPETQREAAKTADNLSGLFLGVLGPAAVVLILGGVAGVVVSDHDAFVIASVIGVVCLFIRFLLD